MTLQLFNTRTRQKENFVPQDKKNVRLYACGPTVYNFVHIGNLRSYLFEDTLRRTLARAGFGLTHVMNITDVGHLQSDADDGEDKMSLAAAREQKSPWDIARFYEDAFFNDCTRLDILRPHVVCRATDHIADMIAFVQKLEEKGYAYRAGGNIYFDTEKFTTYRDFARLPVPDATLARVDADENKRNPADFVLWFTLEGSKYPNQIMKWDSPWGTGFPGWHIECSAMATRHLGAHIDIHCGGIDHIPVHHTNEIAQSEACLGHRWVETWMHNAFLILDGDKMSKSSGNFLTLQKLVDAGYHPMHFRYLCLAAHYRGQLKFSYDSLDAAKNAYDTLCHKAETWRAAQDAGSPAAAKPYIAKIDAAMRDDLNSPVALAALWEALRDDTLSPAAHLAVVEAADSALGLGGALLDKPALTPAQTALLAQRAQARADKDWAASDALRDRLAQDGIMLKDRPEGTAWYFTQTQKKPQDDTPS